MSEENGAAPVAYKCMVHRSLERLKPGKACGQSLAKRSTLASPSGNAKKTSPGHEPEEADPQDEKPEEEEAYAEEEEELEVKEEEMKEEEEAYAEEEEEEMKAEKDEELEVKEEEMPPGLGTNLFCFRMMSASGLMQVIACKGNHTMFT